MRDDSLQSSTLIRVHTICFPFVAAAAEAHGRCSIHLSKTQGKKTGCFENKAELIKTDDRGLSPEDPHSEESQC